MPEDRSAVIESSVGELEPMVTSFLHHPRAAKSTPAAHAPTFPGGFLSRSEDLFLNYRFG